MNFRITHPALHRLLWQRGSAKLHNAATRLRSPRHFFITLLAVTLACVWLSQAVIGIFFRQPADPALLVQRIAWGLMGLTAWQISKAIFRKPIVPFEWTPGELQVLQSAPVARRELVGYRLITTIYSVILKALCFALMMMPDLTFFCVGVVGCGLSLLFCEFTKTIVELFIYGVGKRGRAIVRAIAATAIGSLIVIGIAKTVCLPNVAGLLESPAGWKFLLACILSISELTNYGIGAVVASPFKLFAEIILASTLDKTWIIKSLAGASLAVGALMMVYVVDYWMGKNCLRLERQQLKDARKTQKTAETNSLTNDSTSSTNRRKHVFVPFRLGGIGSIAWRQLLGAWHYRSSIFFSFLLPAILCCIPLFTQQHSDTTVLFLVGSIAFYSYLLLPAALMLDFRRDVDRLGVLKTLPISSTHVVLGQLLAPTALCSVFQATVLIIGAGCRVESPLWLLMVWLAFIPMNLLIMSFENLIFMLHPYRRNKEGVDVFLRTILTFTGKGLTWGAAAACLFLWLIGCEHLAQHVFTFENLSPQTIKMTLFIGGSSALVLAAAILMIVGLVRLFERYDPSSDSIAMN